MSDCVYKIEIVITGKVKDVIKANNELYVYVYKDDYNEELSNQIKKQSKFLKTLNDNSKVSISLEFISKKDYCNNIAICSKVFKEIYFTVNSVTHSNCYICNIKNGVELDKIHFKNELLYKIYTGDIVLTSQQIITYLYEKYKYIFKLDYSLEDFNEIVLSDNNGIVFNSNYTEELFIKDIKRTFEVLNIYKFVNS